MIEYQLIELFDTLPEVESNGISFKVNYDFGTEKDKNRFLESKRNEGVPFYPLIWLITPIDTIINERAGETTLTLLIATLTKGELSNRIRVEKTFVPVINPVRDDVIKALQTSGFTKITNEERKEKAYFNYDDNQTTDIWDVLKIEVDIEFTDCDLNDNINY